MRGTDTTAADVRCAPWPLLLPRPEHNFLRLSALCKRQVCVTRHMSLVIFHMIHVTCDVSRITQHSFKFLSNPNPLARLVLGPNKTPIPNCLPPALAPAQCGKPGIKPSPTNFTFGRPSAAPNPQLISGLSPSGTSAGKCPHDMHRTRAIKHELQKYTQASRACCPLVSRLTSHDTRHILHVTRRRHHCHIWFPQNWSSQ